MGALLQDFSVSRNNDETLGVTLESDIVGDSLAGATIEWLGSILPIATTLFNSIAAITVRAHLETARTAGLGKDTCLPSSLGNGKGPPEAVLGQTRYESLRLRDLRHLQRRGKAFERGREDGVRFRRLAGRSEELGECKRRLQAETAGTLLSGDVDRGPEGLLSGEGIRGIAFQQDFAAEAMDKGKVATIVALTGEGRRIVDALQRGLRGHRVRLELREQRLKKRHVDRGALIGTGRQVTSKFSGGGGRIIEAAARPSGSWFRPPTPKRHSVLARARF